MTKVIARVHPVHLTNTYTGYSFISSSHTVAENKYNKQKLNKRNEKNTAKQTKRISATFDKEMVG